MLVIPVGQVGSCKGIIGVYTIKKAVDGKWNYVLHMRHDKYEHFYSNYRLTVSEETDTRGGNLDPLDLPRLAEQEQIPDHSVIALHEAHRWMDSWNSMRLRDEAKERRQGLHYFVIDESRKRDWMMIWDTQNLDKLDNRVRESCSFRINCMNFANDPVRDFPMAMFEIIKDPEAEHFLPEQYWHWVYQPPTRKWYRDLFPLYDTKEKGGFWKSETKAVTSLKSLDPIRGLVASK